MKYSVTGSSWTIGRVGQLIIQPGAIVHLDCIAERRRGNPSWRWTNLYKEYPTGESLKQRVYFSLWNIAKFFARNQALNILLLPCKYPQSHTVLCQVGWFTPEWETLTTGWASSMPNWRILEHSTAALRVASTTVLQLLWQHFLVQLFTQVTHWEQTQQTSSLEQ